MNWEHINSIKDLKEREIYIRENLHTINLSDAILKCKTEVKTAYNNEQAIKIQLNSSYGAIASQYFIAFNTAVAEAVTLQGQELLKYTESITNNYFKNIWHKDFELHKLLEIDKVNQIHESIDLTIYQDTDSVGKDSIIDVEGVDMTIEDYFNSYAEYEGFIIDNRGNEIIYNPSQKVLNWDNKNYYANVKKIIRHKVSKPKWILKTENNKIEVTGDHSLIVFRNGIKIEIKAKDINIETDLVLEVFEK